MLLGAMSCQIRKSDLAGEIIWREHMEREKGPESTCGEAEGRVILAESPAPSQPAKCNKSHSDHTQPDQQDCRGSPVQSAE